jgi:DNA-binding NarL/FixJ family response regulator
VTRIVVVDEHPIVRRGIAALLEERPEFRLCGEADGLPGAIKLVRDLHPHLVLVELTLQDGSGLELIKELSSIDPVVRICVFSMHDEALFAERALRAGARGFLSKRAPLREVLSALRRILDGRVYLSDQMTDRMLARAVGGNGDPIERSPIETLSDRELEVFEQVGRGVTTRQIAEQLFLSPKTVETYRENIKVKLNLHNATELTQHAVKWVLEKSGAIANED